MASDYGCFLPRPDGGSYPGLVTEMLFRHDGAVSGCIARARVTGDVLGMVVQSDPHATRPDKTPWTVIKTAPGCAVIGHVATPNAGLALIHRETCICPVCDERQVTKPGDYCPECNASLAD
jgi:hypothetical protein